MFFDDSRADRRKRANKRDGVKRHLSLTSSLVPAPKSYELLSVDELFDGTPRQFVFDTECYKNYWLCAFKCMLTGKIVFFESSPEVRLNTSLLGFIIHRFLIVGFNSRDYDMPMIACALTDLPPYKLKQISDEIIKEKKRPYDIEREYCVKIPDCNHIDLIEVAPIDASLKIYGGRLHCERMQDLPYPEETVLEKHQAMIVRDYCINDLDMTEELYLHLLPHIQLREILGKEYSQDMRSKSDAQVAEAIIGTELDRVGPSEAKPNFPVGSTFYYKPPEYVNFKSPVLQELQHIVSTIPFIIKEGGKPGFDDSIMDYKPYHKAIKIVKKEKDGKRSYSIEVYFAGKKFKVGGGGLHSCEENIAHIVDANTLIVDRDVASYYPYIILNNGWFPSHLGENFLKVYRAIVMRRLHLKKIKDPLEAGLKIAINGIFGKLGNIWSKVYAPNLLTQVTMTGQLSLFMQIEMIELAGIETVSANTDGVVIKCPVDRYADLDTVIMHWENITGFTTEETRYKGLFSRDVNNYYAVKLKKVEDEQGNITWLDEIDGIKTKGAYCDKGSAQNSVLSKNPESYICSMAVQQFLTDGTPVEDTIVNCRDLKRFVSIKAVKGGAEKDGQYLGKAVRWYYAHTETGAINYVMSGNQVGGTEGAKPCMIMPKAFPNDIDFDCYVNMANKMLYEIGYYKKATTPTLF